MGILSIVASFRCYKRRQKYPDKPFALLQIKPQLAEFKYCKDSNVPVQPEAQHIYMVRRKLNSNIL